MKIISGILMKPLTKKKIDSFKRSSYLLFMIGMAGACQPKKENKQEFIKTELVNYVDPFIGTGGHGHTYPGATVPFGMVQLSPDNGQGGWDWCSGYHYSDSIVVGFSHTHLSGTGIGDMADILLMPTINTIELTKQVKSPREHDFASGYSHDNEEASPGYYSVLLESSGIEVELTASERVGFHKYQFPASAQSSIVLDLGYEVNWDNVTASSINIEQNDLITGYRRSEGWAEDQRIYYAISFSKPFEKHTLADSSQLIEGNTSEGVNMRGEFHFGKTVEGQVIKVKVGISYASIDGAKKSLTEIPHWNFDLAREDAARLWEKELSKIKVESEDEDNKIIFYTAMYHSFLAPVSYSDLNDEYKGADGSVNKTDGYKKYSIFSLWDTFRAQNPLMTIVQPDRINDFINSMLAHYREYGLLPVWELVGNETNTMTGYHAVPVMVDAYFKGFRDYDVDEMYASLKASAMQDIRGVDHFKEFGFVPADRGFESVTKNLEYAFDDWCIARLARELGKTDDYEYFMTRARSYSILFDKETGFMRGKLSDGSWRVPFDPKHSEHRVNTDYTEGNAWQHSWFVPHDVSGLIELHGGNEAFVAKLDQLFSESSEITGDHISSDISGLIGQYAHGNEPSHHIAYLYNYADAPSRTQEKVREIMESQYSVLADGLSGNEDCGQMSAWYVFSAMGLYPVNPASGKYDFGSPIFERTTINVGRNKTLHLVAKNVSDENKYIKSIQLNGKKLFSRYLTHDQIVAGGTLIFEMSSDPTATF